MKLLKAATSLTQLWCTWVLSGHSYFTFTPALMAELDFQIYCPMHALLFLSTAMAGRWFLGSTPLKVLRSAVKTNLLINPIDRFKNRGKWDLHTAGMINALTDFFPPRPKSDFLCFEVKEREGDPMPIDLLLCRRECKAFYYALKGRAF